MTVSSGVMSGALIDAALSPKQYFDNKKALQGKTNFLQCGAYLSRAGG